VAWNVRSKLLKNQLPREGTKAEADADFRGNSVMRSAIREAKAPRNNDAR